MYPKLRLVGLLWLLCAAPALAVPPKKTVESKAKKGQKNPRGSHGKKGRSTPSGPPLPPPSVELRSIDLATGHALVDVVGAARAPESRLFTLTDERDRRYLPQLVSCNPQPIDQEQATIEKSSLSAMAGPQAMAGSAGRWRCSLDIPRIYQRSALVGLSVQLRGQTVTVPRDKVQAAWAEARAATPLQAAERPRQPGTPWSAARRPPDAGPTADSDEVDSESEE